MVRWLVLLGLLFGAGNAAAALEYCVGNVSELNAALAIASSPTGQNVVIMLKQGTYHVGGSRIMDWHEYNAMEWHGGYNADCSVQTLRPSNTVIDGDGAHMDGLRMHGDLTVEGLRFQNMSGNQGSVFFDTYDETENSDIRMFNNEFLGIGVFAGCFECDWVGVVFAGNLVVNAPADGIFALYGYSSDVFIYAAHNTVVNSGTRGIYIESDGTNTLANNVVWNNPQRDIWIDGDTDGNPGEARYWDNLYGDRYGDETSESFGTLHDDPLFVSATNFRLQTNSPGVNSGTPVNPVSSVDLDGHSRVIGSAPDRGAYEAQVDDTVPATLTVTTTADSGAGSLRQAIVDANANPDYSFINFDIAGGCPRIITLASALPAINQGVRIDGYTQPESSANTRATGDNAKRCVIVNGGGSIGVGFDYTGTGSTQFWMQGIAMGGFTGAALRLFSGANALIWGNQFGGKSGSTTLLANGVGISMTGFSTSASIGGDAAVQRNVIAGSSGNGIQITSAGFFSSTGNEIIGNLIGTYGSEALAAGNSSGVWIETSGNTVRNNVIVHSALEGVHLEGASAHGNTIDHNRIGRTDTICFIVPPHCLDDSAPNQRHGVRFAGGAHDNVLQSNSIWNSGQMGISVSGAGHGNRLSANSVYSSNAWGIDLDGSGLNDNDTDAAAANLPNRGLNYPIITRVYGGNHTGWVEGMLDSINDSYLIQVFTSTLPDNQPNGEGEVFLRTGIASISDAFPTQNGRATFRIAFNSPTVGLDGRSFALTAIDSAGNTSEFSFSQPYLCDVIFRNGIDNAESDSCEQ
jgi:parallel beta-helix repeat protein